MMKSDYNNCIPSSLPGVVPDEDDVRHPGDAVQPGQLPLPVDVDAAALDVVLLQGGGRHLELRVEGLTGSAPVGVELQQGVWSSVEEILQIVSGEAGRRQGRRPSLRSRLGARLAEGAAV